MTDEAAPPEAAPAAKGDKSAPETYKGPPQGRNGFNLLKNTLEQEREAKERKILVSRIQRAGRRSENPLLRTYMMPADPGTMDRVSESLRAHYEQTMGGTGTGVSTGRGSMSTDMAKMRATMKKTGGLSITSWADVEPRYDALTSELALIDAELGVRETRLSSTLKEKGVSADAGPISPEGYSKSIKKGSNVWGSSFKWQGTENKSTYVTDMKWHIEPPETKNVVFGGRYGETTASLDNPSGNAHIMPGKGRKVRPKDMKSPIPPARLPASPSPKKK